MAVDGVDAINPSTPSPDTSGDGNNTRVTISEETLKKMTAKEILDGYNTQNWAVPEEILTWAKNEIETNPNSKSTYGDSAGAGEVTAETNDAVDYQATLEEQGMSLKDQCKEFTRLSAEKEVRDLGNVTKMAPFTKNIPQDETDGDTGESEVSKVLQEIVKDIVKAATKSWFSRKDRTNFKEGIKFFNAFKDGTSDELYSIDDSLEQIQDVLSGTLSDSKDSKQYGEKTIELGKELKSRTKGWQIFGSRRRAAKKAIEQGDKTVKMSDRTNKLATAIAKDNDIALTSLGQNIKVVDESKIDGEEGGETPSPEGTPAPAPVAGGGDTNA